MMTNELKSLARVFITYIVLNGGLSEYAPEAQAQSSPDSMVVIPKLDGPIELDGRMDEAAWNQALALSPVQHMPNYGDQPTESSVFLIGYTDDYFYAACYCYDSQSPSATSFRRDYYSSDTDYFILVLDTFNDNENGLVFQTTPTGLRADEAVFNDASGNPPSDTDWNGFWDVATTQNEEGWYAEVRIPVSTLRFQDNEGQVVMGLSVSRYIARKNEVAVYPDIAPNWGDWSPWKPSLAQDVVLEDLKPGRLLRITPYLLGGIGREHVVNDVNTAYERQTEPVYDAGVDIKYGLTSNLTLDVTLNTDFAQVEADNQEINLTRFPIFFPEKRRFFLQRSSNFAFNFGGPNRLFYSRRIGLNEGRQVRILGGARLVGRTGPWDIGVLNMQTARENQIDQLPSENFGVARIRRQVINSYSYVGGMFVSRVGMDGTYNIAYGMDGIFRIINDDYASVKWAQTFEDGYSNRLASVNTARLQLQWERRMYRGFSYSLSYDRAGEDYRPALGFELRENYFRLGDRLSYGWIPGRESVLQSHRLNLRGEAFFRNTDGSMESLLFGPQWELQTKGGHGFLVGFNHRTEDLRVPFSLSEEVEVPAGDYSFGEGLFSYSMPGAGTLRTSINITAGSFFDGRRGSLQIQPTWNASRYLRITGTYQFDRISFPERRQAFISHISRIRLELTPNVEYSVQSFIQYNSSIDGLVGNFRFRYNPREGNDLYIVYNEVLNTNRYSYYPVSPLSQSRAVMVKYTYTF